MGCGIGMGGLLRCTRKSVSLLRAHISGSPLQMQLGFPFTNRKCPLCVGNGQLCESTAPGLANRRMDVLYGCLPERFLGASPGVARGSSSPRAGWTTPPKPPVILQEHRDRPRFASASARPPPRRCTSMPAVRERECPRPFRTHNKHSLIAIGGGPSDAHIIRLAPLADAFFSSPSLSSSSPSSATSGVHAMHPRPRSRPSRMQDRPADLALSPVAAIRLGTSHLGPAWPARLLDDSISLR